MYHLACDMFRTTTDVAVAVHRGSPSFLGAGQVEGRVLTRMVVDGLHVAHHVFGIGAEVGAGTLVPTQCRADIGSAPTEVLGAPADGAMQPGAAAPNAVSRNGQRLTHGVEPRIGCLDLETLAQGLAFVLGRSKEGLQLALRVVLFVVRKVGQIATLAGCKLQRSNQVWQSA